MSIYSKKRETYSARLFKNKLPTTTTPLKQTEPPPPTQKGEIYGRCNVTACQGPDAFFFNKGTRKYYCAKCAAVIRSANRDMVLYPFFAREFDAYLTRGQLSLQEVRALYEIPCP